MSCPLTCRGVPIPASADEQIAPPGDHSRCVFGSQRVEGGEPRLEKGDDRIEMFLDAPGIGCQGLLRHGQRCEGRIGGRAAECEMHFGSAPAK